MSIYVVGSINMDLAIKADYMPDNGVTITGSDFFKNPGGKGANQAVASAKMNSETYMVGCVGRAFGEELIVGLNSYRVNTQHVKLLEDTSSGIAVIVIVDSDNRIILDKGANAKITKEMVDLALASAKPNDYLICQLEIPQDIIKYALEIAKTKKMITVFNPAPALSLISGILPLVDYFIVNQSECKFYSDIYPSDLKTREEAALRLKKLGIKNVIITLGLDGSCAYANGEEIYVPALVVKAIDTTAAGDTYIGTLVSSLEKGKTIKEAMKIASTASSITVTRKGAQVAIPYFDEVMKVLK